jgi:putative ABC transport system permease protein
VSNLHGYSRRFAGAVTTLAIAVVFVLTYAFTQTTLLRAQSADTEAGTRAQFGITASTLGGIPDGTPDPVRSVPGVRAAVTTGATTVLWQHRMLGDITVDSQPALVLGPEAASVLDLGVKAGNLDNLRGRTVAVGQSTHLSVGDRADLILGDGTRTRATVAAVYGKDLGFGPLVLARDLAAGHTSNPLPARILVRTDGSTAAADRLAELVRSRPGLVLGPAGTTATGPRGVPADVWINLAAIGVLLGYLLLGIADKLVAATTARRTEFATLRLNGTTARQIRSMTRREAGLITVTAAVAGLALAAVPMLLLGIGLLHRPWPAGPIWLLPATLAVVVGIGVVSIELATRHALRLPPAQALAHQE